MGSSRILGMIEDGEPRRGKQRRRVMLTARLSSSSKSFDVRIRDVSATGARLEGRELPAIDTAVLLTRGSFSAYGKLVWVSGELGGMLFDEPLSEERMMDDLKGLAVSAPAETPFRRVGLNRSQHPRFSDGSGWVDQPRRR
jgi:hypothetical protein